LGTDCNGRKKNAAGATADKDFMIDTFAATQICYHDTGRSGLTGCLKLLQDQIAVSQHTLVAMQIFYHDNRRRGLTGCPGAGAISGSQSVSDATQQRSLACASAVKTHTEKD